MVPSRGASGGILTIWNSAIFDGTLVDSKAFGMVINFTSVHNRDSWTLVNVYGPCQQQQRDLFVDWLYHLSIPFDANWLLLGDFNLSGQWITEICLGEMSMTCSFSMR